jgi:hypothetical protein
MTMPERSSRIGLDDAALPLRNRWFADSPLEGSGFEPSRLFERCLYNHTPGGGALKGEARGLVANRGAITISIMLAPMMQGVDTTIANVAPPHMQGSLSAAQDQIAWVLTSYIIAAAIMTPLTGWLAGRFGIKYVFLISVAGFTARLRSGSQRRSPGSASTSLSSTP